MAGGGSPLKKLLIFVLCAILLALIAAPLSATADSNENITQAYKLTILGDNTLVFSTENPPTLWERPTLTGGQYMTATGSLTVHNTTSANQKIGLRIVELPFDNEEALRYLNYVYITVRSGSKVLYEGPYSRINDDRDFNLNTELGPNKTVEYFIDLRCEYAYTGAGFTEEDVIKWEFYAVDKTADNTAGSTAFSNPALWEVLFACGIAALLLGGIFVYNRFVKNR